MKSLTSQAENDAHVTLGELSRLWSALASREKSHRHLHHLVPTPAVPEGRPAVVLLNWTEVHANRSLGHGNLTVSLGTGVEPVKQAKVSVEALGCPQ